jgi:hypothetical protein
MTRYRSGRLLSYMSYYDAYEDGARCMDTYYAIRRLFGQMRFARPAKFSGTSRVAFEPAVADRPVVARQSGEARAAGVSADRFGVLLPEGGKETPRRRGLDWLERFAAFRRPPESTEQPSGVEPMAGKRGGACAENGMPSGPLNIKRFTRMAPEQPWDNRRCARSKIGPRTEVSRK